MKRSFTLVELIVVVAILSLLATIVIPNVQNVKKDAIAVNIQSTIRTLQTASDIYGIEHNGTLPTLQPPTIETPQKINMDHLYPTYIKGKPDETNKYWIDYTGKVWGSTVEAPTDFFESDEYIEWKNNRDAKQYRVYEIVDNKTTSDVVTKRFVDLGTILGSDDDIIQLEKQEKRYLISSVDQYALETAPVGLTYKELQSWFKPIQGEEGTFTFEIVRDENMIFEGYSVSESKPQGTSITYEFGTEKDSFATYVKDIKTLPPSKHLKVKITTKSYNGKYPSLYSMSVYFHLEREPQKTVSIVKKPSIPASIPHSSGEVYEGQLNPGEKLMSVRKPESQQAEPMEIWYVENTVWKKATSVTDVPSGATFYVWIDTKKSKPSEDPYSSYPIIVSAPNPTVKKAIPVKEEQPSTPKPEEEKWTTLQTLTFLVSAQNEVKWLRAEYDQDTPDGTRIEYRFATSKGTKWSAMKTNIADLERAPLLRVTASLQQKSTLEDKSITPKLRGLRIYNDEGYVDSSLNKPTVVFNDPSLVYEAGTTIPWGYTANDPLGHTITKVEWSGNKQDSYSSEGNIQVGIRVQNSEGIWSDWTYKDITIMSWSNLKTVTAGNAPYYFRNNVNSYIKKTGITNFPTQAFTIDFSIQNGISKKADEFIFSYATSSEDNEVSIRNYGGMLSYGLHNVFTTTNIVIDPTEYNHYSLSVNTLTKKVMIYKDGQLVWTKEHTFTRNFGTSGVIFLGQDQDSLGGGLDPLQSMNGFLDNVRVWNVQLADSQIKSLHGKSVTSTLPSLIFNVSTALETQQSGITFSSVSSLAPDRQIAPYFYPSSNSALFSRETAFPTTKWTISFWMNHESRASGGSHMFSYATSSYDNAILVKEAGGKLQIFIRGGSFTSTMPIPLNTWMHITVSWDSSTGLLKMYQDGKLYQTTTFQKGLSNVAAGCVVLGQDQDSVCGGFQTTQVFAGLLKDVNVYTSILTDDQVAEVKNHTSTLIPWKQYIPYSMTIQDFYKVNNTGFYQNIGYK